MRKGHEASIACANVFGVDPGGAKVTRLATSNIPAATRWEPVLVELELVREVVYATREQPTARVVSWHDSSAVGVARHAPREGGADERERRGVGCTMETVLRDTRDTMRAPADLCSHPGVPIRIACRQGHSRAVNCSMEVE